MTGHVTGLQARIEVSFRILNQPDIRIEFVIDTGFEGFLTLSPAAIRALGLPYSHDVSAKLANNQVIRVDVHFATIVWDGEERDVLVLAMEGRPLLGTALLDSFNLNADFADGGAVTLTRL